MYLPPTNATDFPKKVIFNPALRMSESDESAKEPPNLVWCRLSWLVPQQLTGECQLLLIARLRSGISLRTETFPDDHRAQLIPTLAEPPYMPPVRRQALIRKGIVRLQGRVVEELSKSSPKIGADFCSIITFWSCFCSFGRELYRPAATKEALQLCTRLPSYRWSTGFSGSSYQKW